jgi:hypothetical protein
MDSASEKCFAVQKLILFKKKIRVAFQMGDFCEKIAAKKSHTLISALGNYSITIVWSAYF